VQSQGSRGSPKARSQQNKRSRAAGGLDLHHHRKEVKWGRHTARLAPSLCSSTGMQMAVITCDSQGRGGLQRCSH